MARALYTLILYLLTPAIGIRLWWRARRQPEYLEHVGERFGRYASPSPASGGGQEREHPTAQAATSRPSPSPASGEGQERGHPTAQAATSRPSPSPASGEGQERGQPTAQAATSRPSPSPASGGGQGWGQPTAQAATSRNLIWIHAVSVGETRAAQPLVRALLARYPQRPILITHMTPTGRQTSTDIFGDRVLRGYLPYDYPFAARAFLRHFKPALGILMETELWPNLIASCRAQGVPLLLANARMSEKSAAGYRRIGALTRQAMRGLSAVAAQTDADALRLQRLGARDVAVLGNLKFDIEPPVAQIELGRALRQRIGARGVLLAASTREGEEALILDAFGAAPPRDALLLIVPRHPQRFDEVARLIAARGFELQRRSDDAAIESGTRVLLGDSMGEMFVYYAACDVAFIGGSLLALGGQNLIEACAAGAPVLVGPHTFNFAEATEQAIAAGAAHRVVNARELMEEAEKLLGDAAARRVIGAAGLAFAARHRGATQKTLELVERFLPA